MIDSKSGKLSDYNINDELEKMRIKYEGGEKVFAMLDRVRKYCHENNCNYDDLIEAHRQLKSMNTKPIN